MRNKKPGNETEDDQDEEELNFNFLSFDTNDDGAGTRKNRYKQSNNEVPILIQDSLDTQNMQFSLGEEGGGVHI